MLVTDRTFLVLFWLTSGSGAGREGAFRVIFMRHQPLLYNTLIPEHITYRVIFVHKYTIIQIVHSQKRHRWRSCNGSAVAATRGAFIIAEPNGMGVAMAAAGDILTGTAVGNVATGWVSG